MSGVMGLALGIPFSPLLNQVQAFTPANLFKSGEKGTWQDPSSINLNWRNNQALYSEQLDQVQWSKSRATVSVTNALIPLAPNGTATAEKLIEDTTATNTHIAGINFNAVIGAGYHAAGYLKAGERQYAAISLGDTAFGVVQIAVINLTTGATATVSGAPIVTVENAGDGWWRLAVAAYATSTVGAVARVYTCIGMGPGLLGSTNYTGDGVSGIHVWGMQYGNGIAVKPYQPITTAEFSFLDYQKSLLSFQDVTGVSFVSNAEQPVGILLDRKNGIVRKRNVLTGTNTANATVNTTVVADAIISPSGAMDADYVKDIASSSEHYAEKQYTVIAGGALMTYSMHVKSDGSGKLAYLRTALRGVAGIRFSFDTGIAVPVSTIVDYGVIPMADGWFRIWASYLSTTVGLAVFRAQIMNAAGQAVYLGDGTGYYVWGQQLEYGTLTDYQSVATNWIDAVPGNHAIQATTTARPLMTTRVNALVKTELFNDSSWVKAATTNPVVTEGFAMSPIGDMTATRLQAAYSGFGFSLIQQTFTFTNPTGKLWVKSNTGANQTIHFAVSTNDTNSSFTVTPEWTQISKAAVQASGTLTIGARYSANGAAASIDVLIWGVQAGRAGVNYQRVNTGGSDYDIDGFKPYLLYDGIDDVHVTTFPDALGSNCTVARAIPGVGASILTGQTVGTTFSNSITNSNLVIVDRALTSTETAKLTTYLNSKAGL